MAIENSNSAVPNPGEAESSKLLSPNKSTALSAVGALIATIYDSSVTELSFSSKFGTGINKIFNIQDTVGIDTAGAIFVIAVSGIIGRYMDFRKDLAALTFGLMIFSTISVIIPLKAPDTQGNTHNNVHLGVNTSAATDFSSIKVASLSNAVFPVSSLTRVFKVQSETLETNATTETTLSVSSCKPSYYGFFGLGSFLNNSLRVCDTGRVLQPGTAVKIVAKWETWPSKYNYAEVIYFEAGEKKVGWVQAGWKDEPWGYFRFQDTIPSIPSWEGQPFNLNTKPNDR